jgi:formate C-acetyltransferase
MEYSNTEQLRLNWLKVLELVLNGGTCMVTYQQFPLKYNKKLNEITSFEKLLSWFKEELVHFLEIGMKTCTLIDSCLYRHNSIPFFSSTMDDCVEKGQDAGKMGTKYRFSSINNSGMANVVDSLIAINEMVFEKHMVTLEELRDILINNFRNKGYIMAYAKNKCQKFGNDEEFSNSLMDELVNLAIKTVEGKENSRGSIFQIGMYSVNYHASMGKLTGASADGRLSGMALANGMGPVQGADREGPTAVMNSVTVHDHTHLANGIVLDLKFSPSFFRDRIYRGAFRSLVKTYFKKGGQEVQFNVVDRQSLIEAQKNPDEFYNLIVRVSGFSAYFVTLDKTLQDEIINRTEYGHL